jgi:integrase
VVDVGPDPASGRRRQRTKGGFATKREAERALREVVGTLDEGTYVAPDPQTLGEWLDRWLDTMAPKIRESTLRDYRNGLRRVKDRLGKVPLQSLRPLDLEQFYASLLKEGRRYGGGLAPKTVRNIHIALRRSLADAHRYGLVSRNVATLVKPPAPVRAELSTWTAADVREFLAAVEDDRLMPAYRLLVSTGMRRGEVLGLRWSDVDLGKARLTVNRSLTVVDQRLVWSSPKTPRSRRSLSLDPETVAVLRAHRARQAKEKLVAGPAWTDDDLVFCNEFGEPLHPNRFTRSFRTAVGQAGVRPIRLHDLRHTWATLALQAGVHPKVVSERLGHATTSITLDIYSHVQPELDAQAASTVAQLFSADANG